MIKSLELSMLGIKHDIRDIAPLCPKYGIEAIGAAPVIFEDEKIRAETAAVMNEYGLKWGLLPMCADFYHWELDDDGFNKGLEELKRRAEIGETLGITYAYNHVWSASSRPFDENFAWHVERVAKVTRALKEFGVHYGLEFLGPHELRHFGKYEFVHSLSGVVAIAGAAGEGTGVAFDSYHWHCSNNGDMGDVMWMAQHPDHLVAFHMNDADPDLPYNELKDMERRLPMETGVIDTKTILSIFKQKENDALYMIEPFSPWNKRFAEFTPEEAVRKAAEVFDKLE